MRNGPRGSPDRHESSAQAANQGATSHKIGPVELTSIMPRASLNERPVARDAFGPNDLQPRFRRHWLLEDRRKGIADAQSSDLYCSTAILNCPLTCRAFCRRPETTPIWRGIAWIVRPAHLALENGMARDNTAALHWKWTLEAVAALRPRPGLPGKDPKWLRCMSILNDRSTIEDASTAYPPCRDARGASCTH